MRVERVGFTVASTRGGYRLRVMAAEAGALLQCVAEYEDLSHSEMIDVLLAELDVWRPGWEHSELGHQPPLWDR